MTDRLRAAALTLYYLALVAVRHPDSRPIKH